MKDCIINKIFAEMQDDIKIEDHEYLFAKKNSYEIEKEMVTELSDEQKEKLKRLIDCLTATAYKESQYNFYSGFKVGAKLIFELLF